MILRFLAKIKRRLPWLPIPLIQLAAGRLQPISREFGLDLGRAVDRYYIEAFLAQNSDNIYGRVLEIAENSYTRQFGGERVEHSDVLHAVAGNEDATLTGNLATGEGIPKNCFNSLILTQTLPFIYDFKSAITNSHQALQAGGTLLATFPGISQISRYDMDRWGDYWRFTSLSARKIFENAFGEGNVEVTVYGNVKVACSLLQGLPLHALSRKDLDYRDEDYEVIIGIKAVKR